MSLKNNIGFFEEKEGLRSMMRLSSFILLLYFIISNVGIVIPIIFMDHSYTVWFLLYHLINNFTMLGYVFIPKLLQKKTENGLDNSK